MARVVQQAATPRLINWFGARRPSVKQASGIELYFIGIELVLNCIYLVFNWYLIGI